VSPEAVIQWLRVDGLPSPKALCQDNISFITNAINQCYTSHSCSAQYSTDFVPTRLLDLRATPYDTPMLVITSTCPDTITKYAALSYCWGPDEDSKLQLKTSASTLRDRMKGIPVASMSPVMRDSVEVCRALSIRHLWIDSVCIIQGDTVDWDRESQVMGKIFMNSHVTICAVASASCMEGFLHRQPQRFPIQFRGHSGLPVMVLATSQRTLWN